MWARQCGTQADVSQPLCRGCRALSMWYNDKQGWQQLASRIMTQDWSWLSPGLDYIELYYKACSL